MSLLAITDETAEISLSSERLIIKDRNGGIQDIPLCEITRAVICGYPHISLQSVLQLLGRQCPVCFVSSGGKWRGELLSGYGSDLERFRKQFLAAEAPALRRRFAEDLISAKIRSQRRVLSRLAAVRKNMEGNIFALKRLSAQRKKLCLAESEDDLRGMEGAAAELYFSAMNMFLPPEFQFSRRSRNPPEDRMNALLSFCYTVTAGELSSHLRMHGLDSRIGCFHRPCRNFPALAWDLLEVFRAPFCDMLCLHLVNHRVLRREHFCRENDGPAVSMTQEGRKRFFAAYEKKASGEFQIPGERGKTSYRKQFAGQSMQIVNWIERQIPVLFFRMP